MIQETREFRVGYIGVSEVDKTTTHNRMVEINIVGTLPILAGEYIDRITRIDAGPIDGVIEVKEMLMPTPEQNYNVLVDLSVGNNGLHNKLDRYVFLGKALSTQYTGLFVDFYYDSDFKDIIAIPELKTFGYDDNVMFYANDKRAIKGYTIGQGAAMGDKPYINITLPLFKDNDGIERPKRFTKTKTYTVTCYGLEGNSMCNSISREQTGTSNYSEKGAPLQFVEFELNSVLFENSEKLRLNTFNMLQQFHAELKIDYVGKRKIHKIVIPINF